MPCAVPACGAFCCGGGAGFILAGGVGSLGGAAEFVPPVVPAGFVCVGTGSVDGFGVAAVCAMAVTATLTPRLNITPDAHSTHLDLLLIKPSTFIRLDANSPSP